MADSCLSKVCSCTSAFIHLLHDCFLLCDVTACANLNEQSVKFGERARSHQNQKFIHTNHMIPEGSLV